MGDKLRKTGTDMVTTPHLFIEDNKAQAAGGFVASLIGIVIVVTFMANAIPTAYDSWTGATDTGGAMENASDGDKSIWDMGGLVIVGGCVVLLVSMFFPKK